MKKIIVSLVSAGALAVSAGAANAQMYVSGSAGLFMPEDISSTSGGVSGTVEFDKGPFLSAAIGYKYKFGLRAEVEGSWARTSVDKVRAFGRTVSVNGGDNNVYTGMVNAFYDIPTGTSIQPYVGGGIGVGHISDATVTVGGIATNTGSATDFAFQLEGGVAFPIAPNLSIVPAYRYLQITSGGSGTDDATAHIIKVGLKLNF
jgi:opacity protein-like surface antigen